MITMPGITISAGYGAGGSTIAPQVAERMGWTFLDRAITSSVAERLHLPVEDVVTGGPQHPRLNRFLSTLAHISPEPAAFDHSTTLLDEEGEVRRAMEETLRTAVRSGGAVILGRAGACALLHEPDVLRVRLYGPREARIAQAARVEQVDVETARRRIDQVDPARDAYVKRLYRRSAEDSELYHLQIDSTALPLEACVEAIVTAYSAARQAA
jgi:cytidylate kinase